MERTQTLSMLEATNAQYELDLCEKELEYIRQCQLQLDEETPVPSDDESEDGRDIEEMLKPFRKVPLAA